MNLAWTFWLKTLVTGLWLSELPLKVWGVLSAGPEVTGRNDFPSIL